MSEAEDPHILSKRTTPTWEVELLISGVAVFAMLQLPGWLDDAMLALAPRLDETWLNVARLAYVYSKSAAVILAVTFVLHLLLRARWIALVGMHSIYPQGVRWDRLGMGKVQREVERKHEAPTEKVIEQADNLATTVFALGIMLAMLLVVISLTATLLTGVSTLVAGIVGYQDSALPILAVVLAACLVPYIVALELDRRFGAKLAAHGRLHTVIRWTFGQYARFGVHSGNNRIRALLASNGNSKRLSVLIFAIVFSTVFAVIIAIKLEADGKPIGSYSYFPFTAPHVAASAHYDDTRNPARDPLVPFVQSKVVAGDYLALVVPYSPRRDGAKLQHDCSAIGPSRDAALLACLARLHAVTLDGKPVAGLHYDITSDARTNRPALLAMIDVRALARGRHELRIAHPPQVDREQDEGDPGYDSIPFWK
ncbi:MAG: hypothetical protein IT472_05770 [Thermomonas sp.]|uniref:hypothetical protein n=1 Tax=Thermomonas sp. TaxID=1971895 RepID=UPI002635A009|nr:hypothetical protein [Thermomonas sp.]MCC7096667.1 hypothetical protein [Thermomonas sp.]